MQGSSTTWKAAFQKRFDRTIDAVSSDLDTYGFDLSRAPLLRFLKNGGKHLRPFFFLSTWSALEGEGDPEQVPDWIWEAACGIELFQAFLLIHDDIIDQALTRRSLPSLHEAIRLASDDAETGRDLALVLGDILYARSQEMMLHPKSPPERSLQAGRYFARIAHDTGLGEALELELRKRALKQVDLSTIERVYFLKTTRYSFEAPLLMGSIYAGADADFQKRLAAFAQPLGLAFQIENDLHEMRLLGQSLNQAAQGKPLSADFETGVRTWPIRFIWERFSPEDQTRLTLWLDDSNKAISEPVLRALASDASIRLIEDQIEARLAEAKETARDKGFPKPLQETLRQLCDHFSMHRQHSEAAATTTAATTAGRR